MKTFKVTFPATVTLVFKAMNEGNASKAVRHLNGAEYPLDIDIPGWKADVQLEKFEYGLGTIEEINADKTKS